MKNFGLRIVIPLILFSETGVVVAKDYVPQAAEAVKTQKEEEKFIQNLGDEAIEVISKPGITTKEVQSKFHDLLSKNFAVESIARYSLGKNFRVLSESEKKDFLKCFKNMLIRMYSSRFSEYKSSKFVVTGSRKKSAKQILVTSKITVPNKEDIPVVWSVFLSKGSVKVYDVVISDVSVSNIQRSEFAGKISKEGLAKFLKDFKEKYK
jgi:phospholipid transport system substrate-binding protein